MTDIVNITLRGKTGYFRFTGDAHPNYEKTANEWTTDLYDINPEGLKAYKKAGVSDRIKCREDKYDGEDFISLRHSELTANGKPMRKVPVLQADGKTPWPEDILIGNGSTVDVKLQIKDNGKGRKKSVWPKAFRIVELVEYAGATSSDEFDFDFDVDEDELEKQKSQLAKGKAQPSGGKAKPDNGWDVSDSDTDDLEDDLPF